MKAEKKFRTATLFVTTALIKKEATLLPASNMPKNPKRSLQEENAKVFSASLVQKATAAVIAVIAETAAANVTAAAIAAAANTDFYSTEVT